ncbi:hypothetical protein KPL71_007601 [Citrus sinensis]|uniref:Uncharacterized protein n=1 Tax=Citrus sinensis TaxID=2711 RepID=A0ACB8M081_CITSI|nr:hypothetical protein KPL71_007601 [Citrus sinensis]
MSLQRDGGSLARPPVLDGTNYAYWKQIMEIYLTAIDERVWQCVLTGYTPPIKIDEDGVASPKPVREWTNDELDASGYNVKGLNAIVNGVNVFQHQLISACKTSKAAWDILQNLVGGLIVHNDSSKHESNIIDASTSESSHLAPCKEDTDSRLDTIVQHINQNNDSDSNVSDIDINDKKAFHESYKMMFAKWEEVYNENVTLMTQVSNLLDDKAKLESEVIHYKSLLTDKDNQLLAMTTELENTKKSLKMMSSGTQMLYHILSLGKSSLDHHGLRYQHGKDSNSQGTNAAFLMLMEIAFLEGHRSSNHRYKLTSSIVCHKTTLDDTELWHQKLGHLNYKLLARIVKTCAVKGVPMLKKKQPGICSSCQSGKQQRARIKPFRIKQHQRCYNYFIWILWDQCKLKVWLEKVFGSTSSYHVHEFVSQMKKEFEMSMVGELTYFLGLQVKQMENEIFVNQSKYVKSLVKRFGLDSAKHLRTPMSTNAKLTVDHSGSSVDPSLYRSMIGSLLYLTASRLDICFSIGVCARYQANPKESHLAAVKRIIRFVSGIVNDGIWYTNDTNSSLAGYSDADWAGNIDDRKSTTGGCFYLGNNLVSWHSKKQSSISFSTAEAEYIAAGSCCTQLVWMIQMLADYGMVQDTLTMFCDNTSAINISKNHVQHCRTKHIDIRHHFIRDLVESKTVPLEYIDIKKQLADICTKALDSKRFESLRKALVMIVCLDSYLVIRPQIYADTMLNTGESSHAHSNPKRRPTLTPYLCSGCGRSHKIHILDDDEDFDPKFGQIPPEESMHSSDSDSMESDPSEDSFHSGPSSFDPRITTNVAIVHAAIIDHQPPPHTPSRAVTSGAPPSTLRDLPTFVATFDRSSPPSASFAPNLVHLEATILKQGQDIANLSTRLAWPNCMQNYFPFVIF